MTSGALVALSGAVVLAALDWVMLSRGRRSAHTLMSPLAVLALVMLAVSLHPSQPGIRGPVILALLASVLGGAVQLTSGALLPRRAVSVAATAGRTPTAPDRRGRGGPSSVQGHGRRPPAAPTLPQAIGSLALVVAHLAYVVAFLRRGVDLTSLGFGAALVTLSLLGCAQRLAHGARRRGGRSMMAGMAVHLVALALLVVLGIGTDSLVVAYASVLLGGAELLMAYDRLVRPRLWTPVTIAVCYHLAQLGLVLGLLR